MIMLTEYGGKMYVCMYVCMYVNMYVDVSTCMCMNE